MFRKCITVLTAGALLATGMLQGGLLDREASAASSQAILGELYGKAVHAFHSRHYEDASDLLSQAIKAGSVDPRCYYFRGVAQSKLGHADKAKSDFETGAQLEATNTTHDYNVGLSLQRVQGKVRLQLETIRFQARVAVRKAKKRKDAKRYERLTRRRPLVKPAGGELAKLPAGVDASAADETDPFGEESDLLFGAVVDEIIPEIVTVDDTPAVFQDMPTLPVEDVAVAPTATKESKAGSIFSSIGRALFSAVPKPELGIDLGVPGLPGDSFDEEALVEENAAVDESDDDLFGSDDDLPVGDGLDDLDDDLFSDEDDSITGDDIETIIEVIEEDAIEIDSDAPAADLDDLFGDDTEPADEDVAEEPAEESADEGSEEEESDDSEDSDDDLDDLFGDL